MRWKAALGFCAIATALAAPVFAQERLGDVAGSIKLNRNAGDDVIIEAQPPAQSRRSSGGQSNGAILKLVVEDGLTQSRAMTALVEELRTPGLFTDPDWRSRIDEASLRLDMVQQDLMGVQHSGRYDAPYALAEQGIDLSVGTSVTLMNGIAQNRLKIKEPLARLEESEKLLESALNSIAAALRAEDREETPPPIDPVSAAATIREFCGGRNAEGSQPYADCTTKQDAAYRSALRRTPFGLGLDEAEFNTIRNACRYEWPTNFVSQDRCEKERMARQARR